MDQIKRQFRTDADGFPVCVYFRQVGGTLMYRYLGDAEDVALYHGDSDDQAGRYPTVEALEAALPDFLG